MLKAILISLIVANSAFAQEVPKKDEEVYVHKCPDFIIDFDKSSKPIKKMTGCGSPKEDKNKEKPKK